MLHLSEDSVVEQVTPSLLRVQKLMISDKFRTTIEAMPHVIVWGTNLKGDIVFCCGGGLSSLSSTAKAVEGVAAHIWLLKGGDKHEQSLLGIPGVTRDKDEKSGQTFISAYGPNYDEDGKLLGAIILSINITNFQDNTEKQLQETLVKLQEIVNVAIIPLSQLSKTERFFTWVGANFEDTVKWAAPFASKAITIALTAVALWIAQRLGVLDGILKIP